MSEELHLGLHRMLGNPLYRAVALSIPLKSQCASLKLLLEDLTLHS